MILDHKGQPATKRAYMIGDQPKVGYFGDVAVGNGRYAFGYLKEVSCATKEIAEAIANDKNS